MSDFWSGRAPAPDSPYYPFPKVTDANTLAGAEQIPYILTRYLMDLPSPGYTPPEGNQFPRARLKKLLYWDGGLPLEQPLPTAAQMMALKFDPARPDTPPDAQRGYRIFTQELVRQAQSSAQSLLRIYLGGTTRIQQKNEFIFRQTIVYTVMVNYALETNTGMTAESRAFNMVQAIVEATEGVNIGGIGGLCMSQITKFDDERVNTGYKVYQYIDWNGGAPNPNFA
ncbi:MAG: hypothetical protein DBX49_01145 [Clostridia bacterium]|nr:MAG: hypothetical protein DBX49_01145 [Clostridia bacterium]